MAIAASVATALDALTGALSGVIPEDDKRVAARRVALGKRHAVLGEERQRKAVEVAALATISPEYLSRCLADVAGPDAIFVNEYPLRREHCLRTEAGTFFAVSPAGGLGWGLPAALGIKLAHPDRLVIATLGDGSYMFANPTACHWTAAAQRLPVLAIVFNNETYGAVRGATLAMYADGTAAEQKEFMANLGAGNTAYEKIIEAHGGVGLRVERPEELMATLEKAVGIVENERKQVLVNVICRY